MAAPGLDPKSESPDLYPALVAARTQLQRLREVIMLLVQTFDLREPLANLPDEALAERGFAAANILALREALQPLRHFSWLEGFRVAGCARPLGEVAIRALTAEGIGRVITLTEQPLPERWLNGVEIEVTHVPMPDLLAPDVSSLEQAVAAIDDGLAAGRAVAVHCNAGIGRTATVLAAFLVSRGYAPGDAADAVTRARPRSRISPDQREVLARFSDEVRPAL